jgi:hypothetical protein
VAASPIAWVLAELIGYPLVARSCEPASNGVGTASLSSPSAWMVALTILLTVVAASGLGAAVSSVRATLPSRAEGLSSPARPDSVMSDSTAAWGRARFMAVAGVFVSSIFLAGTVLYGLPSLIVNVCAQVR